MEAEAVQRLVRQLCWTFGHERIGSQCYRCGLWLDADVWIAALAQKYAPILTRRDRPPALG